MKIVLGVVIQGDFESADQICAAMLSLYFYTPTRRGGATRHQLLPEHAMRLRAEGWSYLHARINTAPIAKMAFAVKIMSRMRERG